MSKARAISPVSSFRLVAAYCNRIAWLATSLLKLGDQHGGLLFHCSWLSILASFFMVAIVSFVFVLVLFFSSHRWLPCQYAISVKLNWWRQRTVSGYCSVTSEDNIWILSCDVYNMPDIASVGAFELVWYHDTKPFKLWSFWCILAITQLLITLALNEIESYNQHLPFHVVSNVMVIG